MSGPGRAVLAAFAVSCGSTGIVAQIRDLDPTLYVVHNNDAARTPVLRVRVTNDTARGSMEGEGDAEAYNQDEIMVRVVVHGRLVWVAEVAGRARYSCGQGALTAVALAALRVFAGVARAGARAAQPGAPHC